MIGSQKGYAKSEYVTWRMLGGGTSVLLDLKSGRYYTLNETASTVWESLTRGLPVDGVAERMKALYDSEDTEADVVELVEMFTGKGFLVETPLTRVRSSEETDGDVTCRPYAKPVVEEHEAVHELTASGTSSSGGGGHYWYPN